ncbi:XkdX family protein [Limosilactobacillus reuteri]|nr:XkdX family protein [Limosilactobacillus reuteri]
MLEFVKLMFALNNPIEGYVNLVITPDQYKEITGKDYVVPVAQPQA